MQQAKLIYCEGDFAKDLTSGRQNDFAFQQDEADTMILSAYKIRKHNTCFRKLEIIQMIRSDSCFWKYMGETKLIALKQELQNGEN